MHLSFPAFQSHEFKSGGIQWWVSPFEFVVERLAHSLYPYNRRMLFMPEGHSDAPKSEQASFYLERVSILNDSDNASIICAQFALAICHVDDLSLFQVQGESTGSRGCHFG
jgi:hypothetical protein